jgi:hypothetical protein
MPEDISEGRQLDTVSQLIVQANSGIVFKEFFF